jgi:hypothetical protein
MLACQKDSGLRIVEHVGLVANEWLQFVGSLPTAAEQAVAGERRTARFASLFGSLLAPLVGAP